MSPITSTKRTRRTLGFATSAVVAGCLILAAVAFALDAPTIDNRTPQVGQMLTASGSDGTWQWFSCAGDDCAPVGTNSTQYTAGSTDQGRQLKVQLTVADESATSAMTDPVAAQPPPPPSSPVISSVTISGTPYVGNELTADGVTDSGSVTWRWQTCAEPESDCNDIPGATAKKYVLQYSDAATYVRAVMTATVEGALPTSKASARKHVPEPPAIILAPEIEQKTLEVGATATSTVGDWDFGRNPKWQWMLCHGATVNASCDQITGATGRSYVVASPDASSWLGVRLTVQGNGPDAVAYSEGRFIAKPEDPVSPTPPAPFTSTGTTPDTPTVVAPTLLDPFPIVRIKGRTTRVGARLTLLSVRAPRGTRIRVRCRSDYCPRSRLALNTRLHRLSVFERSLRAGVVIEVRVMHPKKIGKYTRFLIRRAAPPLRRDACLAPGSRKPTRCPGN